MNQNEQDNKPERTAMQILIDEVQARIDSCEYTYKMQRVHAGTRNKSILRELRSLRKTIAKYIELRDTVEKEQWVDAYATGAFHFCELELDDPTIRKEGNDNYNEKYGTDGK